MKYLATHLNSTQKAIFYCKEAHASNSSSSLFAPENCNSATDNRKEQLLQLSVQGELGVKGPCIALLLSYLLSLSCPSSPLLQTDLSPCLDQSHLTSISSAAHPFPLSFPPAFWDAFVFCLLRYLLELHFPGLSVWLPSFQISSSILCSDFQLSERNSSSALKSLGHSATTEVAKLLSL